MSGRVEKDVRGEGETVSQAGDIPPMTNAQTWRQVALITLPAIALYIVFRLLPTGSNLNHIDFRTGGSPGSLEMCDPSNPQFIPVMAVKSPVSMSVSVESGDSGVQPQAGREVRGVVRLATASGKLIGPVDLLVMHTRKLHLLVVDPTLTDYQHLHPEPGVKDGEWVFVFTPKSGGVYRLFADFTPTATGRGLYAGTELAVSGASGELARGKTEADGALGAPGEVRRGGFVFSLVVEGGVLEAGKVADLAFTIAKEDGGAVPLEPVMDAYAHLVAFDEGRSGFAHLHPNEADLAKKPDATEARLTFKITIPQRGRYVIWAQVNLGGVETFVAFPVSVK